MIPATIKCKCGRNKNHRGATYDVLECDECQRDFGISKPETAAFSQEEWVGFAQRQEEIQRALLYGPRTEGIQ